MLLRCSIVVAASALAASTLLPARAQTAALPASAPASSAPAAQPGRQLSTPAEKRDASSMPGDLRPDGRVTPQIVVPLRKTPPPATGLVDAAGRRGASSPGGVDDSAARCEAQTSKAARDACRASLPVKAK